MEIGGLEIVGYLLKPLDAIAELLGISRIEAFIASSMLLTGLFVQWSFNHRAHRD